MMNDKLLKHLQKKGKKLDPLEKDAKMGVVKEMGKQASDLLGEKIHPLKKVEVAASSKEGLQKGLNKAEEIVEGAEEDLGADLDKDGEEGESPEHKAKVLAADCSPEELDELINHLQALKNEKEGSDLPPGM